MNRAFRAMAEPAMRHVQASGLNLTDFAILEILLNKGDLPVSTIGARIPLRQFASPINHGSHRIIAPYNFRLRMRMWSKSFSELL
jgi:hypothetical protein